MTSSAKRKDALTSRRQVGVPSLTKGQLLQVVMAIPKEYWNLNCWSCREDGHSTFSCQYLSAEQCLLFSYRYYLKQVIADPQMRTYLEEKLEWRLSKDNGKSRLADKFVTSRGASRYGDRCGPQREFVGSSGRCVQFASGGTGLTQYRGRPQVTERRGVFNVVEDDGTVGDEWGCGPEETDAGQRESFLGND